MNVPDIIIAVDGFSATGKSTFAPLSRYRKPNSFATILAKVLLPVAEKPSTAMMMSGTFIIFIGFRFTNVEKKCDICTNVSSV